MIKSAATKRSRKKKGNSNRRKASQKVSRLHKRLANQPVHQCGKDFLNKTSDAITKRFDTIVLEDLAVSNRVKNPGGEPHNLARSINNAGWRMFKSFVDYKADWRGKNVQAIGRFELSSKLHNTCGYINKDLRLSDPEWLCANCGDVVLRDVNAAINILNFGLLKDSAMEPVRRCGRLVPVESPTLIETLNQEKLVPGKLKRALPDA